MQCLPFLAKKGKAPHPHRDEKKRIFVKRNTGLRQTKKASVEAWLQADARSIARFGIPLVSAKIGAAPLLRLFSAKPKFCISLCRPKSFLGRIEPLLISIKYGLVTGKFFQILIRLVQFDR